MRYFNHEMTRHSGWRRILMTAAFISHFLIFSFSQSQVFFNLTADEVKIDTLLPVFNYAYPLGAHYADSNYTVAIEYPEFVPMSAEEIERYKNITKYEIRNTNGPTLPELPLITQSVSMDRKKGTLHIGFIPLVYRDGQYQKLVSFKLTTQPLPNRRGAAISHRTSATSRYAENSVLSKGTWAKIRVPVTGIYQLTSEVVKSAGFSDINKVKIYGYGGARQPEKLTADYLTETDDLKEVPTCTVNGRRLFYAVGPVSWDDSYRRVRNNYSDYGYYFLTENDSTALTIEKDAFIKNYYPLPDDYCTLYEVDDYAWYHGGRNLYDATEIKAGASKTYTITAKGTGQGEVTVVLSAVNGSAATISLNDSTLGAMNISRQGQYEAMLTTSRTFSVNNLQASNTVTITTSATSGTTRLDYISIHSKQPQGSPDLENGTFGTPEFVHRITNQNHHAAQAADMVIIIPTSQKLLKQAQRIKALHEQHDSLRVTIVPADELYNEFSSGTPDANAYRRYMKMLYDRAETEEDMPRFLLLLGDAAWDNRMRVSEWSTTSVDDFLLCYESENSYSHTYCYVSDDYFGLLDDNEGASLLTEKGDIAVGRISARTADEATIVVDKIDNYINNKEAAIWQNTVCMMGDDGNQNRHMADADSVAQLAETLHPDLLVKRIMWDAYTRVTSATGNRYPDVTRLIQQQMQQGALIMNYSGHGRADAVSHEYVLTLPDFSITTSLRLPLWVTASCDIMPFDGQEENIGETALFNKQGGAIAFFGTTRTVYQPQNRLMNLAFTRQVLSQDETGRMMPFGEAVRRAKTELVTTGIIIGYQPNGQPIWSTDRSENKLQYTLLGDPALRLALPSAAIVVDSINHTAVSSDIVTLKAGTTATIAGRVLNSSQQTDSQFNGIVNAVVRDAKEQIVCKMNDTSETDEPFVYEDRPSTIFNGSDSVRQGQFTFTFVVPKDISYSDQQGIINFYAVNNAKTTTASGRFEQLVMNGKSEESGNLQGPSIYCYLNSTSFVNGGNVNATPYFVAELADEDGINAAGSGIGHDLQLIIDGDMNKTYSLNDYFKYDFGSYTKGTLGYSIPTLDYGQHRLLFRAWDVLNNSSTAELTFNVVKDVEPLLSAIDCTPNPAKTTTTFRITHDRANSPLEVVIDVYDISGRHLWSHNESGTYSGNTLTVDWNLTTSAGSRLHTGVYLYRVQLSCEGSSYASKANKLIVLTHK